MPRHASSYDVAVTCDELAAQRKRGKAIAAEVGRSQSWVSRHLSALRNASAELVKVWRAGELPDEVILRIASLPRTAQVAALADPTARPPAPSRRRPTVIAIKRRRAAIDESDEYWRGVAAALDWVLGQGDAQAGPATTPTERTTEP